LSVGETNHETVLGRLVLVLVLADEALALTVVGLSFAATAKLDLVTREVRLVLFELDKRLQEIKKKRAEMRVLALAGTDWTPNNVTRPV